MRESPLRAFLNGSDQNPCFDSTLDTYGSRMEDILNVPFSFGSFPNSKSLRKLSIVNCLGLASADALLLKAVSMERTAGMNRAEFSVTPLVLSSTIPHFLVLDQLPPYRSRRGRCTRSSFNEYYSMKSRQCSYVRLHSIFGDQYRR